MAGETTSTTLTELIMAKSIEPVFLAYARDHVVATPHFRRFSLIGIPSLTKSIPKLLTSMGTVGDNGSGVDTEFDAAEATDISANTAFDSGGTVDITVAEYGFKHLVTDVVWESTIFAADLLNSMISNAAIILQTAQEADAVALFPGLSTAVGTSGSDLTIAQARAAANGVYDRGCRAPDGLAFVLDDEQWTNLDTAYTAIGTSWTAYPGAADRVMGIRPGAQHGLDGGPRSYLGNWPVYSTGLCVTQNTGADVCGACFTPSTPANDAAGFSTFGLVEKRPFRVEVQRDASARADEVVFTSMIGLGELSDQSGTEITTDAP